MIVFYAPTKIDLIFIKIFSILGLSVHIYDRNNIVPKNLYLQTKKIHKIDLESEDKTATINLINYAPKASIDKYLSLLNMNQTYSRFKNRFGAVKNLEKKLKLLIISSLDYHNSGYVYAYFIRTRTKTSRRLTIINCDVLSFVRQEYKVFDELIVHYPFPFGQVLLLFFGRMKSYINNYSLDVEKEMGPVRQKKKGLSDPANDVAIFYHRSDKFEGLYKKHQYFSNDKDSALHIDNILRCVIYPDKNTPQNLLPLSVKISIFDLIDIFKIRNLLSLIQFTNEQKRSHIILLYRYLEYRAWIRKLKDSTIKTVIIDYDFLFPKALSLALEDLGIKTLALQERPNGSLYYLNYGTICDFYVYSGKLWRMYGIKNDSILAENSYCASSWRNIFFNENLRKLEVMRFDKTFSGGSETKIIVCLGYFLDGTVPATGFAAVSQFLEYVDAVADRFINCSVVIRMKSLSSELKRMITLRYRTVGNVFLSIDYETNAVSYSLCNNADVIVSVQSSLADEALAHGKKVILLDNLFSINRNLSNVYPSAFNFLIAMTPADLIYLIKKVFDGDKAMAEKYLNLRADLVCGNVFEKQSDIPDFIEGILIGR